MERPVSHQFKTPILKTDITGKIPDWCTYTIPYASAERSVIKEGTIVSQYHNHILFFMEVMELNLHEELEASFFISDPSLFLFMVLSGEVSFYTTNGQPIANASGGICYATYNKMGRYVYRLPAGLHRLCYLCPMHIWISRNIKRYPMLRWSCYL